MEEEDQITHLLQLEETSNSEDILSKFAVAENLTNSMSALHLFHIVQWQHMKILLNKLHLIGHIYWVSSTNKLVQCNIQYYMKVLFINFHFEYNGHTLGFH